MEANIPLAELHKPESDLDIFALRTLSRIISLEESRLGRLSGLRVFCRLDISVFRERDGGQHRYFVNEITRTHGAALFPKWDSYHKLDLLFSTIANTLHYISKSKLYLQPPKPFNPRPKSKAP
jgi:hypothetical protein